MIKVAKFLFNNQKRIAVYFPKDQRLIEKIKKVPGALWSQSHTCWHIPYEKEAYSALIAVFPELEITKEKTAPILSDTHAIIKKTELTTLFPKDDSCHIFFYGSRILIFIKPSETYIGFIKALRGVFFDSEKKCWSISNEENNLVLLEKFFGPKLVRKNEPPIRQISNASKRLLVREDNLIKIIRTQDRQLKLYFKFQKTIVKFIRTIPYARWNDELL